MTDDIERELDRQSRISRERTRLIIMEAKMKNIDSGVDGVRRTWGTLSRAQRHLLTDILAEETGYIWNDPFNVSRAYLKRYDGTNVMVRRSTVDNLTRRGLLDWGDGPSPSGSIATLSERALFMLQK